MTSAAARVRSPDEEAPEWGPLLRGERRAGRFLVRFAATAAGTTLLGGLVAMPLSLAHLWRPVVALPVLLVALAVALRASRCVIARPMPPWSLALCLAIAAGAGIWAAATHDEHVVLRRDAGSYALYGQQLADHHGLPIDVQVDRLGGAKVVDDPDVTVASPGFYRQGRGDSTTVVPQFLIGTPAWLSVGMWLGGWTGLLVMPAVLLGLALVALGALAAATVGPRWAPLVVLATAVSAPVLHAGRSTYSEPAALLALCAAMALLASATEQGERRPEQARSIGLLAGLLLGGAGLVRIDALREVVLLVPVVVLLAFRKHVATRPLVVGTAIGLASAAVVDVALARPYLRLVGGSLVPLIGLGVVAVAAGVGLLAFLQRRPPSVEARWRRWLPWVAAGLVVAIAVGLATRPWWMVDHQASGAPGSGSVAVLQAAQGLPVDGTRTYAEQSLTWVVWWLGLAAVVLAGVGAALAAYGAGRVVARRDRALSPWIGPFVVGIGSIVLILLRPGITPDHPWADRRLVVSVLPGCVLLGTAAVAQLVRLARRRAPLPVLGAAVVVGALALAYPAWQATRPMDRQRTELGELGAVRTVCASFRPGDVAVLIGERTTNEWVEVLRGVCNVPTLGVHVRGTNTSTDAGRAALVAALGRVVPEVQAGGGHVVLVADREELIRAAGAAATQLVLVHTTEDQRLLTQRPSGSEPLDINLWAGPAPTTAG